MRIVYRESVNPSSGSDPNFSFWQRTRFIVVVQVMAPSCFPRDGLWLALGCNYGSTPVSAASEGVQASDLVFDVVSPTGRDFLGVYNNITYGSVIKLMHERTKFRLHSHDVPYGSGSGQQSVTGFPDVDDSNSYWVATYDN
ncbi:UNVERIFIED_CONTAM: Stromal cell-derived factor 2-like protein [Sesamum latifolium]|uniref:Stromal cell-derived factor 2-like protein n=1 Tax=Sesamum latifolium TaxID=2727402 RepID=A0AAW2YDN9_9LAMI